MAARTGTARTRLTGAAAAGGLALLLSACGGSSTAKTADAGGTAGSPPASAAAAGMSVTATETEFGIALSQTSFSPGTYTFTVVDKGHATHALTVSGPGLAATSSSNVNGGESTSMTVTLQKGTYRLFCPIGNHAQLGMDTKITVA